MSAWARHAVNGRSALKEYAVCRILVYFCGFECIGRFCIILHRTPAFWKRVGAHAHRATYVRAQADLSEPATLLLCPESLHIIIVSKSRGCLASISSEKNTWREKKWDRNVHIRTHVADCSELLADALAWDVHFGYNLNCNTV